MGQIWAAIKSIGVIAELIRELLKWVRELQRKREIDRADEHHEKNAADIDAAFARPVMRVPEPGVGEPRPAPPESPAVPGGPSGGP